MHPTLAKLERELVDGVGGLSVEQTQMRRGAGKWSIQEIVEHLLLTYASTGEAVRVRLAKGIGTKARPTMGNLVAQMMVTGFGYFPKGREAPAFVRPAADGRRMSGAELGERVRAELGMLDSVFAEAEERFGRARAVKHGVMGPMRISQWRRFQRVHGEHHLRQIRVTRKMAGV